MDKFARFTDAELLTIGDALLELLHTEEAAPLFKDLRAEQMRRYETRQYTMTSEERISRAV